MHIEACKITSLQAPNTLSLASTSEPTESTSVAPNMYNSNDNLTAPAS